MAKGPDPRVDVAPRANVPHLVKEGAAEFNARRFWHAHEAWERAWHALRATGETAPAELLHGLILVAAGLENATRGKEDGFKRQTAQGLHLARAHVEAASALGVRDARRLVDALTALYLDGCRQRDWAQWNASGWQAPRVEVA